MPLPRIYPVKNPKKIEFVKFTWAMGGDFYVRQVNGEVRRLKGGLSPRGLPKSVIMRAIKNAGTWIKK